MKKSLVALAALAATASFAQVTIDGYIDRGYRITNNSDNTKDLRTVASNAGTTTVGMKFRENIGGGMTIGGQLNTDWSEFAGASQTTGVAVNQTAGFANSQSFADISGSFGTIRLGAPNSYTLTNATAVAAPSFSTGMGSAYSDVFSITNGMGTGSTGYAGTVVEVAKSSTGAGARAIRIGNTIQYSSPVFNGFSAHAGFTPQNNNVVMGSSTTAGTAGNTVGVTEYALRYTNGPIDAMYTSIKYDVGSNGTYQTQITAGAVGTTPTLTGKTLTAGLSNTQNLLGVTYAVMPALKLHAGLSTSTSTSDTYKSKATMLGATYTMGNLEFLALMAKVDDQSSSNYDRKNTGLGVNYNLSKTSRIYFRSDDINYNSNGTAAAGTQLKRQSVGISKSF